MQTVLSIVAVVMSALSLGWQAATFALSGARVKATLLVAAHRVGESSMIHAKPADWQAVWGPQGRDQGFTQPVLGVKVLAAGRTAVTVERCSIAVEYHLSSAGLFAWARWKRITLTPNMWVTGPDLPHLMNAGSPSATWTLNVDEVHRTANAARSAFGARSLRAVALVELSNGRTRTARGKLPL